MTRAPRTAAGPDGRGALLVVKVVPGASRPGIAGLHGDGIRVRVAAPPEKGRANDELTRLVARALGVRPDEVVIVRGAASPLKTLHVTSLAPDEVARRLAAGAPPS